MARIRSIHPGLFTDEAFMSASAQARVFMIGIWCEAFDDGVFEWKPVVLKARILPADNIDSIGLLDELVGLNVIKRVERNGRPYGLIRNFRKFQRPKKPNSSGVLIASDDDFVGKAETASEAVTPSFGFGSEPVPDRWGTGVQIPPQMEDGGDKRKEDKSDDAVTPAPARATALAKIEPACLALIAGTDWPVATAQDWHALTRLAVNDGLDVETEILPAIRQQVERAKANGKRISTWGYFANGCRDFARQARSPPNPTSHVTPRNFNTTGAQNAKQPTPMRAALDRLAATARGDFSPDPSNARTIDVDYTIAGSA